MSASWVMGKPRRWQRCSCAFRRESNSARAPSLAEVNCCTSSLETSGIHSGRKAEKEGHSAASHRLPSTRTGRIQWQSDRNQCPERQTAAVVDRGFIELAPSECSLYPSTSCSEQDRGQCAACARVVYLFHDELIAVRYSGRNPKGADSVCADCIELLYENGKISRGADYQYSNRR